MFGLKIIENKIGGPASTRFEVLRGFMRFYEKFDF
jgi:hypothetical protein